MATATKSTTTPKKTTTAKPKTTAEKKPTAQKKPTEEKVVEKIEQEAAEKKEPELVPYIFPLIPGAPDEQQYFVKGINGKTYRWKRGEVVMLTQSLVDNFKRKEAHVSARRKTYEAFKKGSVQIG